MSRILVIGGGLGGIATSARLAKLGHDVTLLEATAELGGACRTVSQGGFTWDAGPTATLLPAVIRDLFRKTGRPLEKELDLQPAEPVVHVFADGSKVAVPGGSRAAQLEAFDALGAGLGHAWVTYVAHFAEMWELLRRDYFERAYDSRMASRQVRMLLDSRESLSTRAAAHLSDPRLRHVAEAPLRVQGHHPSMAPAWTGVDAYLLQRFGQWRLPGTFSALTVALAARLQTRGVTVLTDLAVADLIVRRGRVHGVITAEGEHDADLVVCAIDPARLPHLRRRLGRLRPTDPPAVCHVAFTGEPLPFAGEAVLHGASTLVLRPGQIAGAAHTLTIQSRATVDPVVDLAARGWDLRERIVARLDRDSREVGAGGSAYGVQWRGRGTVRHRWGPHTPIDGVLTAGAHANPGAGVHLVGLSAALVAQAVGPSD